VFSVDKYLERIGYTGPADPTTSTLRELHRKHLSAIPYDNSYLSELDTENVADINLNDAFETVVLSGRGGVCTQTNRLFNELLVELGFDTEIIAASTLFPGNVFGPEVEHMLVCVRVEGEAWLADVGFAGPSFVEPLRLTEGIQSEYGCEYRLLRRDDFHVFELRSRGKGWRTAYRFKLQPRKVADWAATREGMLPLIPPDQVNAKPIVRRKRVVGKDQLTMTGKLCLVIEGGQERLIHAMADPDGYQKVSNAILTGVYS
jgi:amide synthase